MPVIYSTHPAETYLVPRTHNVKYQRDVRELRMTQSYAPDDTIVEQCL